jgi:hypothetical protein
MHNMRWVGLYKILERVNASAYAQPLPVVVQQKIRESWDKGMKFVKLGS